MNCQGLSGDRDMINFVNRSILLQDTNPEAVAKVKASLEAAGIPYKVKTGGTGSVQPAVRVPRGGKTGNIGDGGYYGGGMPYSWKEGGSSSAFFTIYVLKKDMERAKEICDIR